MAVGMSAAVLLTTACTLDGTNEESGSAPTLNIGFQFQPNSLDPAKINRAYAWYVNLAYDSLIYWAPDGSLQPRLATSWNYAGSDNRIFEMKLRPNVTFSDGSTLTADTVKANIDHFRAAGTVTSPFLAAVASVEVVDPSTVRLNLSKPNPELPRILTQHYLAGSVISGEALKNPEQLATMTAGAGAYVLDPSATVANDHYTYKPNPRYWDEANIHYDKVVIKVLPNQNTALSAMKTGQIDILQGVIDTAAAAKSAGFQVVYSPQVFQGLALADRGGEVLRPLGDVRVRQALNYAVDRVKITKGLFGEYGLPTEQIVLPGVDGYNDATVYPYDPQKAKQLLADAGYPAGFTLPVPTTSVNVKIAQAIADDLAAVGVRMEIKNSDNANNYFTDIASKKFPAYAINNGSETMYLKGPLLFLPEGAQFNPFRSSDGEISRLYDESATADASTRVEIDKKIVARLRDQAWFVPVSFVPVFFFARPTVAGVQSTPNLPTPCPNEWRPQP
ncbi:ABC transporter substrate-binding protein [Phytohabitans kaempferiae]|uniref:ABC transporter substrate-binding protein n=1 Tax=Phytohabitans kaempferiae TaxID=1620943 RepID=A0ABV6MHK6_9ACTN